MNPIKLDFWIFFVQNCLKKREEQKKQQLNKIKRIIKTQKNLQNLFKKSIEFSVKIQSEKLEQKLNYLSKK